MTQPERATRRATVRQLAQDGMSQRAIATRLRISKDTVRRDLAHSGAPDDAPPAPPEPPSCATPAPDDETPAPDEPPGCATPPPLGPLSTDTAWLAIPIDDDLRDHLAVLLTAGHSPTDAVSRALELMADAYRDAWDYDECPRGDRPRIRYITSQRKAASPTPPGSNVRSIG